MGLEIVNENSEQVSVVFLATSKKVCNVHAHTYIKVTTLLVSSCSFL